MKRILIYIISGVSLLLSSCGREFLTVRPIEDLTGNNYWQTKNDVDMFVQGLYSNFRNATMNHAFFTSTGDFRCAPIVRTPGSNGAGSFMNHLTFLKYNDLNGLFAQYYSTTRLYSGGGVPAENSDYFGFKNIRNWGRFYLLIQKANIAIYEIGRLESGVISDTEKKRYIAEAAFLRDLSYFFLVRLFGDVPYYTSAYFTDAVGRTPMLDVLEKTYQDMLSYYKDLPWSYTDQTLVGNKAMRGSALALMMHINMWLAGFSDLDKSQYYRRVDVLGKELVEENEGAYDLLPLENTKQIFKGRTKEGLFEIVQNYNYGELFHLSAPYADYVLRAPYKTHSITKSYIHYEPDFMKEMYPEEASDARKTFWFEDIYATNGDFVCLKYTNVFADENNEDFNPDDNQIVFRYADAILLRAEALAELSDEDGAKDMLNMVRDRANATLITGESGQDLKDAIWWERVRELLGEGHFFYDLVRTKKVLNSDYTSVPMSVSAFNQRAWTWPIDASAYINNPYMTPNRYWNF
ncbi:RagB/SusD family nutrient uptake outer membrane protein [Sphingobacterium sp. SGG-5]|uniref:RagB/SusD family nutrient uptake outer membrane protein n=1 Tax=Sphingobacterium sp. SGG-5 TaxID=2710881 RepID=UPI0013EA8879|nr:RagB/SusD family nutrient uptake outer membrane protein [Sphingobacterium sp. SGG-5]NGM61609.1 RagB/SusD family nutrient uptake outer membrane protein [Sphingobacterium sp. SGG-5]